MTENGQAEHRRPSLVRIAPGTISDTGRVNLLIARAAGLGLGTPAPNIFTTLGRRRRLLRRWLWFAGALMPGGRLPRADTELMILRTAHNCVSDYEESIHAGGATSGASPSWRSSGAQEVRHVARRPSKTAEPDDPDCLIDTMGRDEDGYALTEATASLASAIAQLPNCERPVLALRLERDLKQTEIAAELGCSQMQVSRLSRRAAGRLREMTTLCD